jgi:hypothetical protein
VSLQAVTPDRLVVPAEKRQLSRLEVRIRKLVEAVQRHCRHDYRSFAPVNLTPAVSVPGTYILDGKGDTRIQVGCLHCTKQEAWSLHERCPACFGTMPEAVQHVSREEAGRYYHPVQLCQFSACVGVLKRRCSQEDCGFTLVWHEYDL